MIVLFEDVLANMVPAFDPMAVFRDPLLPLKNPINVFRDSDVRPQPEPDPNRVLLSPLVSVFPAAEPTIVLF
jgi:hypothetical protein